MIMYKILSVKIRYDCTRLKGHNKKAYFTLIVLFIVADVILVLN